MTVTPILVRGSSKSDTTQASESGARLVTAVVNWKGRSAIDRRVMIHGGAAIGARWPSAAAVAITAARKRGSTTRRTDETIAASAGTIDLLTRAPQQTAGAVGHGAHADV